MIAIADHIPSRTPSAVPPDLAARCVRLTVALGLPVAGIDLRRTPDDEWICFEVNPSPGFTAYEEVTGQPIAAAIADLLLGTDRSVVHQSKPLACGSLS